MSDATRVVGVIGWPVSRSLSPAIQNAAFAALELDWVYVALPVPPGRVPEAVAGLRALGLAGANVTMPHKTEVAGLMDELSEDAELLRAVNTIVASPDRLVGHNTDAPGFARFLESDAGFDPAGKRALLYGAGGAARACALALARGGLAELTVALRDPSHGEPLREMLPDAAVTLVPMEDAPEARPDLIVNATPLADGLPLPPLDRSVVAVDLFTRPAHSELQVAVREAGGAAFGGIGLLVHQGALSFQLWTAQPAPLAVMSAAALAEVT